MAKRENYINRHENICMMLLDGKPHTPDELRAPYKGTDHEKVIEYKLAYYVHVIRKEGGIIKVVKNGRKIESYQLKNVQDFNENGQFMGAKRNVKTEVKELENV